MKRSEKEMAGKHKNRNVDLRIPVFVCCPDLLQKQRVDLFWRRHPYI